MRSWLKLTLSLSSFVFLSACILSEGIVYQDWRDPYYSPDLVRYAAKSGTMATLSIGQPFEGGKSNKNAAALLNGLRLPSYIGDIRLSPIQRDKQPRGRLVLLFDPDGPIDSRQICGGAPMITRAGAKTMEVQAVFCFGDLLVSEASLKMRRPVGPKSREYHRGMNHLITALLPIRGPNSGSCPARGGC